MFLSQLPMWGRLQMNRLPSSAQDLPDSPPMNMKSPSAMVGVGAGGDAGEGGGDDGLPKVTFVGGFRTGSTTVPT